MQRVNAVLCLTVFLAASVASGCATPRCVYSAPGAEERAERTRLLDSVRNAQQDLRPAQPAPAPAPTVTAAKL